MSRLGGGCLWLGSVAGPPCRLCLLSLPGPLLADCGALSRPVQEQVCSCKGLPGSLFPREQLYEEVVHVPHDSPTSCGAQGWCPRTVGVRASIATCSLSPSVSWHLWSWNTGVSPSSMVASLGPARPLGQQPRPPVV